MSKAFLISYTRLLARAGVNAFACCPGAYKPVVSADQSIYVHYDACYGDVFNN